MKTIGEVELARMEAVQCYVGRGDTPTSEMSDVPSEKMALYEKHWWHYVHSQRRLAHTRWVVIQGPTVAWPKPPA